MKGVGGGQLQDFGPRGRVRLKGFRQMSNWCILDQYHENDSNKMDNLVHLKIQTIDISQNVLPVWHL